MTRYLNIGGTKMAQIKDHLKEYDKKDNDITYKMQVLEETLLISNLCYFRY